MSTLSTFTATPGGSTPSSSGAWRPPQWQGGTGAQLYSITVPGRAYSQQEILTMDEANPSSNAPPTVYFFDAVLAADHDLSATPTKHPVQTGASSADHIILNAARLVLEVGMSDAMDSLVAGQYTSAKSRSVSAFQTFDGIRKARQLLVISTRLMTYSNMVITGLRAREDVRTAHAGKFVVTFEQMLMSTLATQNVSARPQQTDSSPQGPLPTDVPSGGLVASYQVTPPATESVPGAGTWSSETISSMPLTTLP